MGENGNVPALYVDIFRDQMNESGVVEIMVRNTGYDARLKFLGPGLLSLNGKDLNPVTSTISTGSY